jgi:hypothetical protein
VNKSVTKVKSFMPNCGSNMKGLSLAEKKFVLQMYDNYKSVN